MNPSVPSEIVEAQLTRIVPIKVDNQLCYPLFKCIHLTSSSHEQLKKDLARCRQKEIIIQLCKAADDYSSSYKQVHSKLFGSNRTA